MSVFAPERHITAEPAFNLRDLGGYLAADGRTVRWRTLFRADGLHRVPGEAMGFVSALSLRTVIDLRTATELEWGRFAHDDVECVHLPVLQEMWDGELLAIDIDAVEFLAARYADMLIEGAAAFATAIRILASSERVPAVFHCSAGKDRTGVLAALVLATLGVSDEEIAADYHLSAPAMEKMVAWLLATRPEAADVMAKQPAAFMSCPPDAMLAFLDDLRLGYGGAEGYLRSIGVDRHTTDALRTLLLD